ncbi:hypothetical protein [Aureivirga sp. CE67]|uniref:hypothetical protein n=1 Tax=Aureivirga sp. CE67 TaxID=1788983 RepID=UPI0018CB5136|nr:hypothetical protein [Aureivirga sp. CE67]
MQIKLSKSTKRHIVFRNKYIYLTIFILLFSIYKTFVAYQDVDFKAGYYLDENSKRTKAEVLETYLTDNIFFLQSDYTKYEYYYNVNGKDYVWTSFTTMFRRQKKGDEILIEYNSDYPEISRIVGMTNSPSKVVFVGFIFMIFLSILLFYYQIKDGIADYHKYKKWHITKATLVKYKKEKILSSEENEKLYEYYEMTFSFKIEDEKYIIEMMKYFAGNYLSDLNQYVIYNPENHKEHMMLDDIGRVLSFHIKEDNGLEMY